MTFYMVIAVRPLSSQAEHPGRYRLRLKQEARAAQGDDPQLSGNVYARIVWFHHEKAGQDVDNIAKIILDSLKGIVFDDDRRVMQCSITGVNTTEVYEMSDSGLPPWVSDRIFSFLSRDELHFIYVEVGNLVTQKVTFGSIEGGS